jgi:clan AA aspartic protease (TIGR02281 family)
MQARILHYVTLLLLVSAALVVTLAGVWFSASMAAWLSSSRFIWIGLGAACLLPFLLSLGGGLRFFFKSLIVCNLIMLVVTFLMAPEVVKQAMRAHGDWPAQAFAAYLSPAKSDALQQDLGDFSGWLADQLPNIKGVLPQLQREPELQGSILPSKGQGNGAVVRFKKSGSTMVVNVTLEDKLVVPLIYDTGASITTLDSATAKKLGLNKRAARYVEVETANGSTRQAIVSLSSIEVGGAKVLGPIEVAICDTCSLSGAGGLLGLNFSRAFLTQIDPQVGTITFLPRKK